MTRYGVKVLRGDVIRDATEITCYVNNEIVGRWTGDLGIDPFDWVDAFSDGGE